MKEMQHHIIIFIFDDNVSGNPALISAKKNFYLIDTFQNPKSNLDLSSDLNPDVKPISRLSGTWVIHRYTTSLHTKLFK